MPASVPKGTCSFSKKLNLFINFINLSADFLVRLNMTKSNPDFNVEFQLDLGPKTIENFRNTILSNEVTNVFWNGPLGAFELAPFDLGTNALAQEAARLTKAGKLLSVAGGGDTISALKNADCIDSFSYVSTAGGAFLEWLEGRTLPGVAALRAAY